MDPIQRSELIPLLQAELDRSLREALEASALWRRRQDALKRHYGGGYELRIAKRDDQMMKDFMNLYTFHRDNSSWALAMRNMLIEEERNG